MTHAYAPALSVLLNPGMRWKSCSNSCSAPAGASIGPNTGARFSSFAAPGCSWASFCSPPPASPHALHSMPRIGSMAAAGFITSSHDHGKRMVLLVFCGIWGFVEIGCLCGNAGPNRYGSNPPSVHAAGG